MRRASTVTFRGETLSLPAMARRYGLTEANLRRRLALGWSLDEALLVPLRPKRWIAHPLRPRVAFRARRASAVAA